MDLRAACYAVLAVLMAAPAAGAQEGVRAELRGVNIDPFNPWANPSPETVRRLGITRVRFVYKNDHAGVAQAVEKYVNAGLNVTIVLNNETAGLLGADFPGDRENFDWTAYRLQFMYSVLTASMRLRTYGERVSYQVWNEQNIGGSYIPPEIFGPLARDASWLLRIGHPGATVILGAILHDDHAVQYLAEATEAAPGLIDAMDALGVHTYSDLPSFPQRLTEAYGAYGKPLSVTEWGECGLNAAQGSQAIRAYLDALEPVALVREAFYFGWSETQSPGCGYGLSEPLDQPGPDGELFELKPAMIDVFQTRTRVAWSRTRESLEGWQDWERASAGGLLAAEAALRFVAGNPTLDRIDEVKQTALSRRLWSKAGMNGPRSQEALLRSLGLQAEMLSLWVDSSRPAAVESLRRIITDALAAGKPVILSTSRFYYFISGVTPDGRLLVDSGREEDLATLVREGGAVNAVLLPS